MKVVVDKDIPFLSGVLEPYFKEVVYLSGKDISPEDVADACAMIIRTRTKCNEKLLKGSSVKFIATATIMFFTLTIPNKDSAILIELIC